MIDAGAFGRLRIKVVGVGGHPECHPFMSAKDRREVLARKCCNIAARDITPEIITQFAFDADIVSACLKALRDRGIEHPVRAGVLGGASVAVLARYAALCGVGACASMWSKHGVSIGKLLSTARHDQLVSA